MSEKDEKILKIFKEILPEMSEMEKEKLLSFGEGMAFVKSKDKNEALEMGR